MRAQTIEITESTGRLLHTSVIGPDGKKLLAKGHRITAEDAAMLATGGLHQIPVAELEEGEAGEDEAVVEIAAEIGCGSVEIRLASGGRANLFATENCCLLVDDELLKHLNCAASIVIATGRNFSFLSAGERVATVKSAPFAVLRTQLETMLSIARKRGPVLQARPIRNPKVAVLYTDPEIGDKAQALFENFMQKRLENLKTSAAFVLTAIEEENAVASSLQRLVAAKPACVIIASTTAPARPNDVVGRAMQKAGCIFERFLAPVEPGNLLLLGYKDDIPIVAAPGCFRSAKPNVLDLILPPMLARYRLSSHEIACLGHGGLLSQSSS